MKLRKLHSILVNNYVLSVIIADILVMLLAYWAFNTHPIFYVICGWIGAEMIANIILFFNKIRTHDQFLDFRRSN